jgi:acetyl-CoA acetyltransferase
MPAGVCRRTSWGSARSRRFRWRCATQGSSRTQSTGSSEAFAAQSLAVIHTLGLDPAKVNPMGGAIALGHPLGATGAIRSATVVHALQRHRLRYGMVTMCVGMGQGAAGIFERV